MPVQLRINNCLECPHHSIESDPDPDDWFCDDDQKVVCKKNDKTISGGLRPHEIKRFVTTVPDWCPMRDKAIDSGE